MSDYTRRCAACSTSFGSYSRADADAMWEDHMAREHPEYAVAKMNLERERLRLERAVLLARRRG